MSDIELLPIDSAEQPGFSSEPADVGSSHDLAVTDGVSGLGGDVRLSDEVGASEFGTDEADVAEGVATTRTVEGDDRDLLGDTEMAETEPVALGASTQKMAADLTARTVQGDGRDATEVNTTGAADPDNKLTSTLAHIDEALGDVATDAHTADEHATQQARLNELARSAQGYQDSAFGPQAAHTEEDRDEQASLDDPENAARVAREAAYARADDEDLEIISREAWRSSNPTFSDHALQESFGRTEASQVALRGAYDTARARYDDALVAHDNYWSHDTVEARQAVNREMQLARDQLSAAGDLLFRDQEVVYDTSFNDGIRYINGVPVPGRAEDSERSAPEGQHPDYNAATLERPHVGDRFGEADQLRERGQTAGERARLQQLERLPHTGFTSSEIRQVRAQIAALGYPVDNFKQFTHKHNERGTEDTIASWLGHGHGEFTVYDLYHKMIPEKRLGTLGHETAHANSPLKPENEAVFGGKAGQLEAAKYVERVAQQSLDTGIHLNGYHKYLMEEYKTTTDKLRVSMDSGELSDREYEAAQAEANRKYGEETWAIMNEMALTNRNGLVDVEARQFKALEDLARQRGEENVPARVALISDPPSERDPEPQTHGIDRWLIQLIDGVNNQQELVQHVATLKQRFYGAANNEKAAQRVQRRYAQAA